MMSLLKKYSRQAIFLYDGLKWHGRVFRWEKNNWKHVEAISHKSGNPGELPGELIDFASNNSAKRVRILIPCEVHNIQVELPDDIEEDELRTALKYELSNEIDIDSHDICIAAARASCFSMGGQESSYLVSYFETNRLEKYEKLCKKNRLTFDGLGPLELGILSFHAQQNPKAQMLFLYAKNGIHVHPANELIPFRIYSIPFGTDPLEDSSRDEERISHTKKQFQYSRTDIHICSTQKPNEDRKRLFQSLFSNDTKVEYIDFSEIATRLAMNVARGRLTGHVNGGYAITALNKAKKAPYRTGTWLLITILTITGIYIGLRRHSFKQQLASANQRKQAWAELVKERSRLESNVEQLLQSRNHNMAMKELMQKPVITNGFLAILEVLAENIPPYTCVTSIIENKDKYYEIKGLTRYQEGLIGLNKAMASAMKEYGFGIELGQIEQSQGGLKDEKIFSCRIIVQR